MKVLKGRITQKWKICHYLLTFTSFQTHVIFFISSKTKDLRQTVYSSMQWRMITRGCPGFKMTKKAISISIYETILGEDTFQWVRQLECTLKHIPHFQE